MYIHSNKEIDKKVNVSKIANYINTVSDDSTAAQCNSRLITVLVQHANDIVNMFILSYSRRTGASLERQSFTTYAFIVAKTHR